MSAVEPTSKNHRYVIVLRASAALRVAPDHEIQFQISDDPDPTVVTIRTRYMPLDDETEVIPRELWIEVVAWAATLEQGMEFAHHRASTAVNALSFALNAGTEGLRINVGFDACDDHDDHDFFEDALLDETGLPRLARNIDADAFLAFFGDLLKHGQPDLLMRAIAQYELALGHWVPGHELMALAHLYMAMEVLTPLAREREIAHHGDREALLKAWKIEPRLCKHCRKELGIGDLDAQVRLRVLFQNESEVYRDSKKASDGFEHGFLGFGEIRAHAVNHRDRLGVLVRHAIANFVSADAEWRSVFMMPTRDTPIPATRIVKYIRATLVGKAASLPGEDQQYPMVRLASQIGGISILEDGTMQVDPIETLTANVGIDTVVRDLRFQMFGPGPGLVQAPGDEAARAEGPASLDLN